MFQAARTNGDVRVCCQANVTKNKGILRKENGEAYNAGKDDLSEARNAEMIKQMRINMLNGVWSEECGRCRAEEDSGLPSRRIYEQTKNLISFEEATQVTNNDGSIDTDEVPIRYFDLRFGNFCNLKCRMCGPTDSNKWYEDWVKLTNSTSFNESSGPIEIQRDQNNNLFTTEYNWPEQEIFWQYLDKQAPGIEYIYFAGGEPMLIENHYTFLEKCIRNGYACNMIIEYNTNLTTLPTKVISLWQHFKEVRVGASIDGKDKVFEYQRHPAKWNKVLKNLEKLDKTNSNVYAWLATTITAYNIFDLVDFMKWKLLESGFEKINSSKRKPIITYHIAHHPKHLNIRVLPNPLKKQVVKDLFGFYDFVCRLYEDENVHSQAKNIAESIESYIFSDDYYNDYWQQFVSYTKKLDEIRGEDIKEIIPKLEGYL
jgi:organic radical activating enzyme